MNRGIGERGRTAARAWRGKGRKCRGGCEDVEGTVEDGAR